MKQRTHALRPLSVRFFAVACRALALIATAGRLSADEGPAHVWIEGERPSAVPDAILRQAGFPADGAGPAAWGNTAILSDGKLLHLNLTAETVEKLIPPEGLVYGYDFTSVAGAREIWARIGYEFVRAPFRWRVDQDAWRDVAWDAITVDVMPIQDFNELGWLKLGTQDLKAGAHRIEFHWPRRSEADKDGKAKVQRILGMLDCVCLCAPGSFRPASGLQPGQDHRTEKERLAAAQVFRLPPPAGTGERTEVPLTGAWEMANWDEDDARDEDRLKPSAGLPNPASLRWFAYEVPGDRNRQQPGFVFHHRFVARCRVDVPKEHAGRSFILDVQRFNMIVTVFVNGKPCGWSKAHSTAAAFDLTPGIVAGSTNEIAIVVKDRYYALKVTPDKLYGLGRWRACWNRPNSSLSDNKGIGPMYEMPVAADDQAGITEPATLIAAGPAYVADAFVKTSVERKELAVDLTLANPGAQARNLSVELAVVPWPENRLETQVAKACRPVQVSLSAGQTRTLTVTEGWADPQLWWPDDPRLYVAVATVKEGGRVVDIQRTRFGFREWTWTGDTFRINGAKWQLWADTDESGDPKALVAKRATSGQMMMRLWANGGLKDMTRRQVLDYFDETGMVVRDSGTFDGQVGVYSVGLVEPDPDVPADKDGKRPRRARKVLFDNWREQLEAWVKAERNHPSILIWSIENEITYINVNNLGMYRECEPAIRDNLFHVMKVDPTRPAMVDGGNCLRDNSLPVNGAHYTEFMNADWRDFPDAAYTCAHFYDKDRPQRDAWQMVPGRPIFKGEVFFANGYSTERFASVGGERCFIGVGETRAARGLWGRILSEGYRWAGVAAWHFWLSDGELEYWKSWQPVAVLCRQWNWNFNSAQRVDRLLKVFNTTSKSDPITAAWELQVDGKKVAGGSRAFPLPAGEDQEWAISFTLPPVTARTPGTLVLTAVRGGKEVFRDAKPLAVLAPAAVAKPALKPGELAVYDPQGTAAAHLTARGIGFTPMKTLDDVPAAARVVVLGCDAIPADRAGDTLWFSLAMAGRRIVVLDQTHPLRYRALPADVEPMDWTGRVAFAEDLSHPVLAGLTQADFFTWDNDHVVYRNAYRKGSKGGRSLVQCDGGLQATALLECQAGEGVLLLSQLAIGRKLATEGVAQQVFNQMLNYAASYTPVRKPTVAVVAANGPEAKLLATIGIQHTVGDDPLAALLGDGIAVVSASPANLKRLADQPDAVQSFCARGGWLMLWGLTPEGLADYNRIVGWNHVIRPFDPERVLMAVPSDSMTAGLTLRDVVMDTGKSMVGWMDVKPPDPDAFSFIVDHTDVAPFCRFPTPMEMGKGTDQPGADHWPRNLVNGYTSDDNWRFTYTTIPNQGHALKLPLELPKEEELAYLRIKPGKSYNRVTQIRLYVDDDPTPILLELKSDPSAQDFPLPPRKVKRLTLELAKWEELAEQTILRLDNIWVGVNRPEDYLGRVKCLLNIGGLMRYNVGRGGIVLNQVKLPENETNPANLAKKRTIVKTLLGNMGAIMAGDRTVVAGGGMRCEPVKIPDAAFNGYVHGKDQPGWFKGPCDLTALPGGEHEFGRVRFWINDFNTSPTPTVLLLKGEGGQSKQARFDGIKVDRPADALFFMHTMAKAGQVADYERRVANAKRSKQPEPARPVCLKYVVTYADGQRADVPVQWGLDIGNWLTVGTPAALPNAGVAWTMAAPKDEEGRFAVVWLMQWTNPRPDVAIASVDIVAEQDGKAGAVAVFAITTGTVAR